MKVIVRVGKKLKFFETKTLKSSIIWPLYHRGQEKQFCLKYVYLTKILRNDILWLQQLASGQDLKLLFDYEIDASDIIQTLEALKNKTTVKDSCLISAINRFRVLDFLTAKVITRMQKSKSADEQITKLISKLENHIKAMKSIN